MPHIKNSLISIIMSLTVFSLMGTKNFVLISAPGSGKGTFSQYLVQKHQYVQICPGDIFRNEIMAQSELGKKIESIVERGDYVDEDIVCQLIADNLLHIIKQNKPFIIDGFPRSEFSFKFLINFLKDKSLMNSVCFLQFMASDDTCINRILNRQICTQCSKVYNIISSKPKEVNQCDHCGIDLNTRKADTQAIITRRLKYFHTNIEPLSELIKMIKIETECSLQELHAKYDNLVEINT